MTVSGTNRGTEVAIFPTPEDARSAIETLLNAGFPEDRLHLERRSLDLKMRYYEAATREGAKGGALIGAVLGALAGYTFTFLVNYLPDSAAANPDANPFLGIVFGAIVGAAGFGSIGALSGSDAPRTLPHSDRAVTEEYTISIEGDEDEIQRAKEILS
ncbi:hypothetical protein V0288_11975 [Pannus brasiliensis CCIBt3594]|uniref:DUF1269 domain-containing protein n=1 Tax=Pannus brasiliensis CCIBt3594 TaxID=1427578 RepID=A0AAW9QV70_9CHRO